MKLNGEYFRSTLNALNLPAAQRNDARSNAQAIVGKVLKAYASGPNRPSDRRQKRDFRRLTGLVYGRIQSGKTRAMIASTALAFDNGFRVVVVLTSNINDLVAQTHFDFAAGLPNVMVYTKDNELADEVENAKLDLELADGRMLIVCSKGSRSLKNVTSFLQKVRADRYRSIIFDDEGDQASLDTNTRRRSRSNVRVGPSKINALIQRKLRTGLPRHVYVSVTGTPQAVLLQSADSGSRPSFIELLPPGSSYIGGREFFGEDEPEENRSSLVQVVDRDEKGKLLNSREPVPDGLRRAILFFLLSSAAAIRTRGLPGHGKGYSFLCHPSLKNDEQTVAAQRITKFLDSVKATLLKAPRADKSIRAALAAQYKELRKTLGARTPPLPVLSKTIVACLRARRILVINARAKRQGIAYGQGLNFLIGGNTLGRGIAIPDLLVTYYLRSSRVSQIDTMHQHARMFGYRQVTLPYTRLFVPKSLYYRFRDVYRSDEDLRVFIQEHSKTPKTFPIEFTFDLRTTRPGVLDVNTTDTLEPGKQVYPNYIVVPQVPAAYERIMAVLEKHFGRRGPSMEKKGKRGVIISGTEAGTLASLVKTRSENTWRDNTIDAVVEKVAGKFGRKVQLKFRKAKRFIPDDGFISTGTLSGTELESARGASLPTLWMMAVESTEGSACGTGRKFIYPTFVIPGKLRKLLMFNRG